MERHDEVRRKVKRLGVTNGEDGATGEAEQDGSMDTWLEKKWIDFKSALNLMPHIPESIKRQIVEEL